MEKKLEPITENRNGAVSSGPPRKPAAKDVGSRGYDISPSGRVEVDLTTLLRQPRVRKIFKLAEQMVVPSGETTSDSR